MITTIHHHTALELRGGAVRIAHLLQEALPEHSYNCSSSFEFSERSHEKAPIAPDELGKTVSTETLVHVHSSGNWVQLLASLQDKPVITLHDCELFTGGCPYPLECEHFSQNCAEPCPRSYPDSAKNRKAKQEALARLNPILISPSAWLARLARKALPKQSIRVIPNGIPWQQAPPNKGAARKFMGIHPAAKVAVFMAHGGDKAAYKAGNRWCAIWDELRSQQQDVLGFALGGDTSFVHNDLHFWPYMERERVAQLLAAADVLLYPSLADNHPLVVLEAQAQGVPAVAFGAGGIPEQIRHEETGLLVPEKDFDAFTKTAHDLLRTPRRMREMGTAAFFHGQKRFPHTRMVRDYLAVYNSICTHSPDTQKEEAHEDPAH